MTEPAHAPLGPSSAERWLSCPASIRFAAQFEHDAYGGHTSEYAEEGTTAHELAALRLRQAFGEQLDLAISAWRGRQDFDNETWAEMNRHVTNYVEFVRRQAETMRHPQLAVEVRVNTGVPDCWGTADCVLFSPWEIKVVDFKYGQGVQVEAEDNPQLKLYALGVLNAYQGLLGDYTEISVSIAQPRIGIWKTATMSVADLEQWRDDVVTPAAALTQTPDAPFGPSLVACRWCPAAGRCSAQLRDIFEETVDFDSDPDALTPAEISDALTAAPRIKAWLGQLEEASLKLAYSRGVAIPDWKVVMSDGRRKIVDEPHAIQTLIDFGFTAGEVSQIKIKGFGELEKIVGRRANQVSDEKISGREALQNLLGDMIQKGEGKPTLVPESDSRAPINPETEAVKVFSKEDEK